MDKVAKQTADSSEAEDAGPTLQDLLKTARYPAASVLAKNEIPAEYGTYTIVELGCKFVYDDEHNENVVKVVNIPNMSRGRIVSGYDDCCRAYFVVMKVRVPGGKVETLFNSKTVDDNYCGGELTWHLVIERARLKGAMPPSVSGLEIYCD